MQNISVDSFLTLPSSISVIDIRSRQNFNNHHIPGAINIPYEQLILSPGTYLQFSKTYYLYCQKGVTSKRVSALLNRMGYHTISIIGGYEEWVLKK